MCVPGTPLPMAVLLPNPTFGHPIGKKSLFPRFLKTQSYTIVALLLLPGPVRAGDQIGGLRKKSDEGTGVPAYVEFDCTMAAADAPAVVTAVTTKKTPGRIWNVKWREGDKGPDGEPVRYVITFMYNPTVPTVIRISASAAISANNGVQLDGNRQAPNGHSLVMNMPQ